MPKNGEQNFRYVMPEIQITDPQTGEPLMKAVPKSGTFDLMIPDDITKEQLLVVLSQTVEFYYKQLISMQHILMTHGMTTEQIDLLFFPKEEPSENPALKVVPN